LTAAILPLVKLYTKGPALPSEYPPVRMEKNMIRTSPADKF